MKKTLGERFADGLIWVYLVVGGALTYGGMIKSYVDVFRALRGALGF